MRLKDFPTVTPEKIKEDDVLVLDGSEGTRSVNAKELIAKLSQDVSGETGGGITEEDLQSALVPYLKKTDAEKTYLNTAAGGTVKNGNITVENNSANNGFVVNNVPNGNNITLGYNTAKKEAGLFFNNNMPLISGTKASGIKIGNGIEISDDGSIDVSRLTCTGNVYIEGRLYVNGIEITGE